MKWGSLVYLFVFQGSLLFGSEAWGMTANASAGSRMRRHSTGNMQNSQRRLSTGSAFVGYHGTTRAGLQSLTTGGLNPVHMGSASGLARGPGFYVARNVNLAADFADNATQAGDPDIRTGVTPRYPGDRGVMALGRVEVQNFSGLRLGRDYDWGVMSGGALRIQPSNARDLEIVLRPSIYSQVRVVGLNPNDNSRPVLPRSHEAPF